MIVKCSHCLQIFSDKDFDSHTCDRTLKECRFIEVSEILDGSYGNKKLMNGWGTDGILYTFEVVPRKPIPLMLPLSDGFSQRKSSVKDFTEPVHSIYKGGIVFQSTRSPSITSACYGSMYLLQCGTRYPSAPPNTIKHQSRSPWKQKLFSACDLKFRL